MTDLNARYGRKPQNTKRNIVVLAGILLIAFFTWAIFVNFAVHPEDATYKGETVAFDSYDDHHISATIEVTGVAVDGTVECTGKALDADYGVVGYRQFEIEMKGEAEMRVQLLVNTTAKAASVVIEACDLK